MLTDSLLFVVTVLSPVTGVLRTRRVSVVLLYEAAVFSLVGLTVQALSSLGVEWTHQTLSVAILVGKLPLLLRHARQPKDEDSDYRNQGFRLLLFPAGVSLIVALRIWQTHPKLQQDQSGVVADLTWFFAGEDNAKWINIVSRLVQDRHVEIGGVGGLFVVFATVCVSSVRTVVAVFDLASNEQSLVLNTVALMFVGLVVLVPVALTPLFESSSIRSDRGRLLGAATAVLIAMALVSNLQNLGHLTAEMCLVLMILVLTQLLNNEVSDREMILCYVVLGSATTLWLGLHFFSVVIVVATGILLIHSGRPRQLTALERITTAIVLVGILNVSRETWIYTQVQRGYLTSLFNAGGAVVTLTTLQGVIAVLSFVACVKEMTRQASNTLVTRFFPFLALFFYLIVVIWNDQWRTGKVNYGSTKLWYIAGSAILCATISNAVEHLSTRGSRTQWNLMRVTTVIGLLFLLSAEGTFAQVPKLVTSKYWSGMTVENDLTFRSFVKTNTLMMQKLSELPIGCAYVTPEGKSANNYETYACTRFLVSLAGLESRAGRLIEWQLKPPDLSPTEVLRTFPADLRSRSILLLDGENHVIKQLTIEEFLDRVG